MGPEHNFDFFSCQPSMTRTLPDDSFGQKILPDLDLCSFPEFLPVSKIIVRDGTFHVFGPGSEYFQENHRLSLS